MGSPSSSPALSHQAKPSANQLQGANFFFDSAPTSNSTATTVAATATTASPSPSQAQKHDDFKSSILSLYSNIPAATPPPQQLSYNGNFQSQMAGLNLGGSTYQQQQQQHQQQQQQLNNNGNIWGSFANASPSIQPQQPQGSQFFSSNTSSPSAKKPEKKE